MGRFLSDCKDTAESIVNALFIKRDVAGIRPYITDDISLISSMSNQTVCGAQNVIKMINVRISKESILRYQLSNIKIEMLNSTDNMAIFLLEFSLTIFRESMDFEYFNVRTTFVMGKEGESVKCSHIHLTVIEDESVLNRVGNFAYLRKAVDDKTEQMNMMLQAINGGFKENWYDSEFTLLYVSEEFIKMLGYTKEEFYEAIENRGLNIIYYSDRERVCQELDESINSSNNYSVEYRVSKKDGSIIWVLESGKISLNEYGQKVMHSLIMDITEKKTIQLELEKERRRYEIALESSTDIIFEYDVESDTFIGYQNICDGERHKLERTVIKNYTNAIVERNLVKKEDRKAVSKFFASGGSKVIEARMRKNGAPKDQYRWMQVRGTITYDVDATRKGIVGTIKDIEQFKKMEEERKEFRDRFAIAISNSYDDVYEINIANGECYAIFIGSAGIEKHDKTEFYERARSKIKNVVTDNESIKEFIKLFDNEYLLKRLDEEGGSIYCEVQNASKYPDAVWNSIQIAKASWDDNVILVFLKNIDEVKREQEAQKEALSDALLAAQRANMAKTDFLSRMSHDIRTPMNAVIGMTDIANKFIDDKEKVLDCLNKIDISSKFLIALINDILDMSKIESQKLVLEKRNISIKNIIKELSVIVNQQAKDKNINFEVKMDEKLSEEYIGDALRINQIIMNFLSNAVKFTSEGGNVLLAVNELENNGKWATIQFIVKDTGEGMTKEFMEKMYNPFEQEDTGGYKHKGSGLGLAIAKNLVSMMNGSINVESELGKGTVFDVKISLAIPVEQTSDMSKDSTECNLCKKESKDINFENQRVLLVEDNEINMEIAKTLLEYKNLQVETAENGLVAVEKVKNVESGYYDIILMDIRMPVMDGLTASKEIRNIQGKDTPIIAMSANAFREDIENAIKSGINGYVTKPIDADKMYEAIRKAFDGKLDKMV